MNFLLFNTKNIKIDIEFINIINCSIKGKCRYKYFKKCIALWNRKDFPEDATCVINEKLRDNYERDI